MLSRGVHARLPENSSGNVVFGVFFVVLNLSYSFTEGIQWLFQRKLHFFKVSKGAKIRNWYNQVPHLNQYTKETNSQYGTTNESQEVSPSPAGDHKAHRNRRVQMHRKHKTDKKKP